MRSVDRLRVFSVHSYANTKKCTWSPEPFALVLPVNYKTVEQTSEYFHFFLTKHTMRLEQCHVASGAVDRVVLFVTGNTWCVTVAVLRLKSHCLTSHSSSQHEIKTEVVYYTLLTSSSMSSIFCACSCKVLWKGSQSCRSLWRHFKKRLYLPLSILASLAAPKVTSCSTRTWLSLSAWNLLGHYFSTMPPQPPTKVTFTSHFRKSLMQKVC